MSLFLNIIIGLVVSCSAYSAELPFHFDQIEKWIQEGKATKIEDILSRLPEEMKKSFSFVVNTRSTQQFASTDAPRVLLHSADGSLVLAFSTASDSKGYQTMEVVQFDQSTGKNQFKLVDFGSKHVIDHHPSECLTCHAGRGIWDTYPNWPGTIGESFHGTPTKEMPIVSKLTDKWDLHRTRFLSRDVPRGRTYGLTPEDLAQIVQRQATSNNRKLNELLSANQRKMIVAELRQHPQWEKAKEFILEVVQDDTFDERPDPYGYNDRKNYSKMVDRYLHKLEKLKMPSGRRLFEEKLSTIRKKILRYEGSVAGRMMFYDLGKDLFEWSVNLYEVPKIAMLEMLTDGLKVSGPKSWGLTFEKNTYALNDSLYGLYSLKDDIDFKPSKPDLSTCLDLKKILGK